MSRFHPQSNYTYRAIEEWTKASRLFGIKSLKDSPWLEALHEYVQVLIEREKHVILLGDFNIAPEDRDVHDPEKWEGKILVSDPERQALQAIQKEGLVDELVSDLRLLV